MKGQNFHVIICYLVQNIAETETCMEHVKVELILLRAVVTCLHLFLCVTETCMTGDQI